METAIVVLGCDLTHGGEKLGPETIARCECALGRYQVLALGGGNPVLVMSPGMANKRRYPKQKETMAIMMAKWFLARGVHADALHYVFSPHTWSTRAEVRTALHYIIFWCKDLVVPFNAVEFVSSTYHLRRIRLVAERVWARAEETKPKLSIRCIGVPYRSSNMLREVRNVVGEFLLGFVRPDWYDFTADNVGY